MERIEVCCPQSGGEEHFSGCLICGAVRQKIRTARSFFCEVTSNAGYFRRDQPGPGL